MIPFPYSSPQFENLQQKNISFLLLWSTLKCEIRNNETCESKNAIASPLFLDEQRQHDSISMGGSKLKEIGSISMILYYLPRWLKEWF